MNQSDQGETDSSQGSKNDAMRTGQVSHWFIRRAARTSPPELAVRLEEEWLADLWTRSSMLARARFVLGCLWARHVISRDYATARLPVAATAFAPGSAPANTLFNGGLSTRRTTALALVAILHVAVLYALVAGFSGSFTKVSTSPLQNRVVNEIRPRDLPPLPPPSLNPVKLDIPKLDEDFTIPADDTEDIVRTHESSDAVPPQPSSQPVVPSHVPSVIQGGPGAGFPSTDDYYPVVSRRLEEQGAATLQVCVDPTGRLTGDPTVVSSSGSARLDEGARRLARAGSGHYRASTNDGRAVASCYGLRIRFQIKN